METPAGVGRKLHGLGAGKQHAEAQRGQERALIQPPALLDQHTVHEGDLCRRASEGLQADGSEDASHLPERGGSVGAKTVVRGYDRLGAHARLQKRLETALGHVPKGAAASAPKRPNLNAEARRGQPGGDKDRLCSATRRRGSALVQRTKSLKPREMR